MWFFICTAPVKRVRTECSDDTPPFKLPPPLLFLTCRPFKPPLLEEEEEEEGSAVWFAREWKLWADRSQEAGSVSCHPFTPGRDVVYPPPPPSIVHPCLPFVGISMLTSPGIALGDVVDAWMCFRMTLNEKAGANC